MKKAVPCLSVLLISLVVFLTNSCGPKKNAEENVQARATGERFEQKDVVVYKASTAGGNTHTRLSLDFSGIKKPGSLQEFRPLFHLPPVQQNKTDACWCFAATSLFESERHRLGKRDIKLSEMHTVYWEFVEKARHFVQDKGTSELRRGSEPNAVIARMRQYGAVRESDYSGLLPGQTEHDHNKLFQELNGYLQTCKTKNFWAEGQILAQVKRILDKYLGPPPAAISIDGRTMTPKEFLDRILQIPFDDYICVISFKYLPFYVKGDYRVPDNWFHSQDYYNVPLDDFTNALRGAIRRGYTAAVAGDISEPGNSGENNLAIIPSFDSPAKFVDQESREFRFDNKTTTDDHVLHLVGYKETPAEPAWFLVKDSWETAYRGAFKGYFFYREDYVKLKTLMFMVHKDAVPELLQKFSDK